jgi:hypothetical protein
MNWYLTKIIYRIICGDGNHTPQFDEQLRLVSANTADEAFRKSCRIGLQEEETFYNQQSQLVQWQFINVVEIYAIDEHTDGAEIFSQIKEADNAEDYCKFVHHKAAVMQENFSLQTLQTV